MAQNSENIAGVSHDDAANKTTIDWTVAPWSDLFSGLPALTADNTEIFDVAFLLALEQACDGKDSDLNSPVGRGALPIDGVESRPVQRSDGNDPPTFESQNRKQIYLAVYTKLQPVSPMEAIANEA